MAASVGILLVPLFAPAFWWLYILAGVSDMIDGPISRYLHTDTQIGATLDSIADIIFLLCCCVRILPVVSFPLWIWVWIACIFAVRVFAIIISIKAHHQMMAHSGINKLTGLLLFLFPLTIPYIPVAIPAIIICTAATIAVVAEMKDLL